MNQEHTEDIIDPLRQLMPIRTLDKLARSLTWAEAKIVAQRQANPLVKLLGFTRPSVEIELVLERTTIELTTTTDLDASARTTWEHDHWHILMNANDSLWRCRSTLAHELKHILDDPYREVLYPNWPRRDTDASPVEAELICDYFAGCVLVPTTWLRKAWDDGVHDQAELASMFDVSEALLAVRLRQVGLTQPRRRDRFVQYTRRACERSSAIAGRFSHKTHANSQRSVLLFAKRALRTATVIKEDQVNATI